MKETKTCIDCSKEKYLAEFGKDISKKDGLASYCKICISIRNKARRGNKYKDLEIELYNKGLKKCTGKYGCRKIKPLSSFGANTNNKLHGRTYMCAECYYIYKKRLYADKTVPIVEIKKCSGQYGCDTVKDISEFYLHKTKKYYLNICKQCEMDRSLNTIQKKIAHNLRSRIRHSIKNKQKSGSAVKDLGCSIDELKEYLGKQFDKNMTWDNYGFYGWHIDHIIPLSSFDLTDRQQFLKACHYTNLQPLWAKENLSKGAKISEEFNNA